jgi:hypothetical protein
MLGYNIGSYTQRRTAGDLAIADFQFLSGRKTARAERCPPRTNEADLEATAYNLKKLLESISAKAEPGVGVMTPGFAYLNEQG